ncbi:MAG TPA: Clp protease N-terminal domain-containing protein, partial [Stenomitos sp.]
MQPTDPGKFTDKAWEAIVKSQDVARKYRNQQLEVEHLVIALLEEDETTGLILERAGADTTTLLKRLTDFVRRQPSVMTDSTNIYLGRGLDLLLDRAEAEREERGDRYISVDHLLLAFAEDKRVGKTLLRSLGLDGGLIEEAIQK